MVRKFRRADAFFKKEKSIRQELKTLKSGKMEIVKFSWTKDRRGIRKRNVFLMGLVGRRPERIENSREQSTPPRKILR
jgi:hypothetical protein